MVRSLQLLVLCTIFPCALFAQTQFVSDRKPQPHVLDANHFLGPHVKVDAYDIKIDRRGYVYMTTFNAEVRRFDGFKMRTLPSSMGAPLPIYHSIHKSFDKELILSGQSGIAVIENDSVKPYNLPDSLVYLFWYGHENLYKDSLGTFHFAPRGHGYFTLSASGKLREVVGKSSGLHGFGITRLEDGTPFHFSIFQTVPPKGPIGVYYFQHGEMTLVTQTLEHKGGLESSIVEHSDSSISIAMQHQEIVRIKEDKLVSKHDFGHAVFNLFIDSRDNLWVGTVDHGIYKTNAENWEVLMQFGEDLEAVVAESSDGGLWATSTVSTFWYISDPTLVHYSKQNGLKYLEMAFYILDAKDHMVCLAPPRGMYTLKDSITYTPIEKKKHREGTVNYDVNPLSARYDRLLDRVWIGFVGHFSSWDGTQWETHLLDPDTFSNPEVRQTVTLSDSTILGNAYTSLFRLKDGEISSISESGFPYISNFCVDDSGGVWAIKGNGLFKLKNRVLVPHPQTFKNKASLTNVDMFYAQNSVWIQALPIGLHRANGNEIMPVKDEDGHTLQLITHSKAPNGDLWAIVMTNGTNRLCKITSDSLDVHIQYFAFYDQACEGAINRSFAVTDTHVYIGSVFGVFKERIENLKADHSPVKTAIRGLRINQKLVNVESNYQLEYDQNFFNILFDGISFRSLPIEFRYKLEGLDTTWSQTEYQEAQYNSLPAGNYNFKVQARVADGADVWGSTVTIGFNIQPPFWETTWFRVIAIIVLLVVIYLIFHFRSKQLVVRERGRNALALEMSQLELKALKAQINPHFIFNAMSSATYYLGKNQPQDAKSYLTRFSRLIRMVLENSEESSIPLSKEIELMQHYISLESERFEGSDIEFNIKTNGIDDELIKVPPALFQPYIENAIWHGLKNKKGVRKIDLTFEIRDDLLCTTIEDNGVGRNASAKFGTSRKAHRSFGMMIASRRIEILNHQKVQSIQIEDVLSSSGDVSGTKVIFSLPI